MASQKEFGVTLAATDRQSDKSAKRCAAYATDVKPTIGAGSDYNKG